MDKIYSKLIELENSDCSCAKYLNNLNNKLVNQIIELACELLVSPIGECNWTNIAQLTDQGYSVFPGEKDRFGWLTGCIKTKKGIITFG